MLKNNAKSVINEEHLTSFLSDVVKTVKNEEDPLVLNEYRRIFRKNVPFTLRSYVAAYFIKEFEGSRKGYGRRASNRYQDRSRGSFSDHPVLDPSESISIFINVGKTRRVFPRDIITLLIQNADVTREHIGDIRILDTYSFVQVMSEDADRIIEKLNNFTYRGRSLSVSYARKAESDDVQSTPSEKNS